MSYYFRIYWTDLSKNRREMTEIDDQAIALFIAKKKVREGMQDVIIQLFPGEINMPDDAMPVIDAEVKEEK